MLAQIKQLKQNLGQVLENKDILDLAKSRSGLQIAITNANLLVNDLISFYEQDNSAYFPKCITEQITSYVGDANAQLSSLLAKDITQSEQLRLNLDKLYALCLQSGITTFGFSSKEMTRLLNETKINIQSLQGKTGKLGDELEKKTGEAQSLVQTWQKQLEELSQTEQKKIAEKSSAAIAAIDKDAEVFKALVEQNRQMLAEHITSSNKFKEEVGAIHKVVTDHQSSVSKLLEISQQTQVAIQKTQQDSTAIKTSIEAELKNAQTLTAQIQGNLNSSSQSIAEINAKKQAADDSAAYIDQRKKVIDDFYKNIEANKEELLKIKKKADADSASIKENYSKTIEDFNSQTSTIIKTNQDYEKQIDETLRKAVTAGLFGAFNKRQKFLSITRFVWAGLVFASAIGLAIAVFLLAKSVGLNDGVTLDKAFVIRTGMIIPLGWLLYFAGAQYKKERHAEEEYAFKSAISYSLEPYRRLLVQMREIKDIDCDFVKSLMQDIFDNPIKRLYSFESDDNDEKQIAEEILNLLKKMPDDTKKTFLQSITSIVAK
jgi:hypothetical protein